MLARRLLGAGGVVAPPAGIVDFIGFGEISAVAASHTFSSRSFGAEAGRDLVVACIHGVGSALIDRYVTGVTIGGVTALQAGTNTTNGNGGFASIWYAAPTGGTGDVVVTLSGNSARIGCTIYRLENLVSPTPRSTGTTSTAPGGSIPLTTKTGGVAVACGFSSSGGDLYSLSGLTGYSVEIGGVWRFHHGYIEPTGTSETITTVGGTGTNAEICAAAWR